MSRVSLHAITVIGHDRPGIIAETTRVLADLGLNLEDSTMTLLRGHFAMMLICAGGHTAAEVEEALAGLTADGSLTVSVREVPEEPEHRAGRRRRTSSPSTAGTGRASCRPSSPRWRASAATSPT